MLNTTHITAAGLLVAAGASVALGAPNAGQAGSRIAIGVPMKAFPVTEGDTTKEGKGGYTAGAINCGTMPRIERLRSRAFGQDSALKSNINEGLGGLNFAVPWDVQLNGEVLAAGNRTYEPFSLWVDDATVLVPGTDVTPNIYPGTNIVIPYRVTKEIWFEDPMDPDVIPPIDNSDPPFPGFPFDGMEVSDEAEAIIIEAMNIISVVTNIDFVEADPAEQTDAFPRGTPLLLYATGAEAELPFSSDDFLDGDGASFSTSVGMTVAPLCMIGPTDGSEGLITASVLTDPISFVPYFYQLLDEEEIPDDGMGGFVVLPGWDPAAHPSIPEGRLPILDVDDIDNDGVAAELGDDMTPGVMWVDWEPRPFIDRRFAGSNPVLDTAGIDDLNGDDDPGAFPTPVEGFTDDDGNPNGDELEGIEISPFTNLIILHPNVADNPAASQGVIIHEIMHAIGFYHEHQRNDRDDFIEILEQNVAPGQLGQFAKSAPGNEFGDFDFESIMHYGPFAFSGNGGVTIRVVDQFEARFGDVIGAAQGISKGDAAGLRQLYGEPECPEDLDGDFDVDLDDWQLFITLFIANNFRADINTDGVVDIGDFIDFLDAFAGRDCYAPPPQLPVKPAFGPVTDPF
ncbi:MAG: hypothetical protein DHS20C14_02040 [Phycisphaeraceae bacterium]|nr:MAG: hypothetical protein DHS20C14_02040 [Phycisphaeraceae bacterium]